MTPRREEKTLEDNDYDYIIVGAGPAGLQMGYFLQESSRKYILLEKAAQAASFYETQPRHGKLLSINKKYNYFTEDEFNLRHDWNSLLSHDKQMRFTNYSDELYPKATDLHTYMNDFAKRFQLNISYNTSVINIHKHGEVFVVKTSGSKSYTARCVLMATGAVEENLPDTIEGLELAQTYGDHSLNKELYKNKIVLVIGGGNSAFETADYLADTAAMVHVAHSRVIKHAWNTHYPGDLRAVNNSILDMYQLKSLHSTLALSTKKLEKTADGKIKASFKILNTHWDEPGWLDIEIEYDHVISCLGWRYVKPELFDDSIALGLDGRYPKISNIWETDTENLFYIGAAMAAIDKKSASGFIHGFRYNIRTLHHLLESRFYGQPLTNQKLPARDLQTIAGKIVDRVSVADSIYQMYGFLCDVFTVDDTDGSITYYTDLPIRHVLERQEFKTAEHLFVLQLNYTFERFGDIIPPIDNVHAPDISKNDCFGFLHPILEYYHHGEYIDQTETQGSLILRIDQWASNHLPQWKLHTQCNYFKFFINDKLRWTSEVFNLDPLPAPVRKRIFTPLTEEEKARIPQLLQKSKCKPPQDLLSDKPAAMKKHIEVIRPTTEEVMLSTLSVAE